MTSCTLPNHSLAFILVLILCQILDYATSQTLSFVDLIRPFEIVQIIRFEDLVAGLVSVALGVCVLLYFFASQSTIYKAIHHPALTLRAHLKRHWSPAQPH